jgi:hypothetical protein
VSPADAANIFVAGCGGGRQGTLADLRAESRRGCARRIAVAWRRLFDPVTPGARVMRLPAAFGEPRAFRVRGTLIALRPEQARRIEVEPLPAADAP